ncbi:centrosomal protein 15 isoform X2 [Vanacampus margaritifer]
MEVFEKHEEILANRAQLLEQMKSRRETMKIQSKEQFIKSEVARQRNSTLLQARYWASVEKSIPVWEHFLLGKEPHPTDCPGPPSKSSCQEQENTKVHGLPPRPKSRPA